MNAGHEKSRSQSRTQTSQTKENTLKIKFIATCITLPLAACINQPREVSFQWHKDVKQADAEQLRRELNEMLQALKPGAKLEILKDGAGLPTGAAIRGESMFSSVDDQTAELFVKDVNHLAADSRAQRLRTAELLRTTMTLEFKPELDDPFVKDALQRGTLKNPPRGRHEAVLDWAGAKIVPYRYTNGTMHDNLRPTIFCKVVVPLSKPVPSTHLSFGYSNEDRAESALAEAASAMLSATPRQFGHERRFSDPELDKTPGHLVLSSEDGRALEFEAGAFEFDQGVTGNVDWGGAIQGKCKTQASAAIPGLSKHLVAVSMDAPVASGLAAVRLEPR